MSAILGIGSSSSAGLGVGPLRTAPPAIPSTSEPSGTDTGIGMDTVELSARGTALSQARALSSLSTVKSRSIRAEILADTYETPARIDATIERLLDVIA